MWRVTVFLILYHQSLKIKSNCQNSTMRFQKVVNNIIEEYFKMLFTFIFIAQFG
jgi:hypothetical protein